MNQRCDTNGDAYGKPCTHPEGGKGVRLENGSMIALSSMNQLCDALGKADRDMEEWETDDEPEPIVPIDEGLAREKVDEEYRNVIRETRALFKFTSHAMRMRMHRRLQEHKKRLRYQLSLLGIRALRPQDIAWNYVVLYNEKIRKLWVYCNQNDPYEKDRVMRQIDDLNHKRQQLLAEVDEEDCVIPVWCFADGWIPPQYRSALPPLEPEIVDQPEPVQQPELVLTQASLDVTSLDHSSDNSDPNGNYGVPGMDLDHMGLNSHESHFDAAFEDMTSSQRYEAHSNLDSFEASLWNAPAEDTASAYLDAVALERLQEQVESTMSMEQAPTQFQFEIDEDIDSDKHSLFSGTDDDQAIEEPQVLEDASHALPDQMDSVPVSFQAAQELQIPDNASNVLPNTEQASLQEQVIEDDDDDSLFGAFDEDCQHESTEETGPVADDDDSLFGAFDEDCQLEPTETGPAADECLISGDNAVTNVPAANPQVSQEQHAVEGDVVDDDDDDDNDPFDCEFEDVIFDTDLSSNQNLNEPQSSPNTCSDTDDVRDLVNSEPIAQPEHNPESPLNPGSEALPTQTFGTPLGRGLEAQLETADQPVSSGPIAQPDQSLEVQLPPGSQAVPTQAYETPYDQGLNTELQTADQPAPEIQAAPDAAPVEVQVTAGQSESTGGEGVEAPSVSQEVVSQEQRNPSQLRIWSEYRGSNDLEAMHQYAREQLCRFWPNNIQPCSNMQLELFASGSEEFEKQELERYEQCFHTGQDYIVEFVDDYNEIPPNMLLTWIDNGNYAFLCLINQTPAQDQSQNMSAGVIDLTGDDPASSAAAAPLGVEGAVLAPPAEIIAAGAPVSVTAGGRFVVPETPEAEEEEATNVPEIPVSPPVDEATFAQASAPLPANTEPMTPVQNTSDGNNGIWSSDWSEQAFSGGRKSPRAPSSQEINAMAHSVRSDNSDRLTNSTGQAKSRKKARGKASKGTASGSLSSVHSAHNALNHHLSQTTQTAGNIHVPPPTGQGPVAGSSDAVQPQQQPASQAAKGKRHVGRPHKDDSELVSPRKRQLQHPDSPCAEPSEGGNKRRRKNAPAAADETDASQAQQHGTPESQPAQYYGPSPDRNLDAKTWIEEHTQGGKGKRGQKRKAPAPKKTPAPRKARKTKEATPPAPRTYRAIAPAPPRHQDHANGVQMQSRASTPMAPSGTTGPSIGVQIHSDGTQIRPAAPHMQNGRPQQMRPAAPHMQNGRPQQMRFQSFQQLPQQRGFQYPASQQSLFNAAQQQNSQYHVGQQNGFTNDEQQEPCQNALVVMDDKLASLRAQVREVEKARSILHQQGQQHGQEYPNLSAQMIPGHFAQQNYQEPMQQGVQQSVQHGHGQPQSFGMTSREPYMQEQNQQGVGIALQQVLGPQMSQAHMATPRMMSNQGMSSNGIAPYRANMHQGYRQEFPGAGFQPARPLHQNGYPAPMNFSQGMRGPNIQGAYGGFDEGVGGAYMAQDEMPYFRG